LHLYRSLLASPDVWLCPALEIWRSDLVAGGDLQLSALKQQHPESVYFHQQTPRARRRKSENAVISRQEAQESLPSRDSSAGAGGVGVGEVGVMPSGITAAGSRGVGGMRDVEEAMDLGHEYKSQKLDDFYSPLTPEVYLDIRIRKHLSFYQQRIPQYARDRNIFKGIIVLLASAASAVSAYGLSVWALVIASASAMLISWTEFADTGRKVFFCLSIPLSCSCVLIHTLRHTHICVHTCT